MMIPKTAQRTVWTCLAATLSWVGCNSDSEEIDATEAVASVELAESQSGVMPESLLPHLFPVSLDGVEPGVTSEQAAAQVAQAVATSFEPAGCATAAASGNVATYQLVGCRSRRSVGTVLASEEGRGHRHGLSGSFTLTFAAMTDGLEIGVVGTSVSGRHATFDVTGTAQLTLAGNTRVLSVTSLGTAQVPSGQITKSSTHTRTYAVDTGCLTLDGRWSFDSPHGQHERTVTGFEQCGDLCPKAGGQLTGDGLRRGGHHHRGHSGQAEASDDGTPADVPVTIQFDGSAMATWSAATGETGTIALACTANAGE